MERPRAAADGDGSVSAPDTRGEVLLIGKSGGSSAEVGSVEGALGKVGAPMFVLDLCASRGDSPRRAVAREATHAPRERRDAAQTLP